MVSYVSVTIRLRFFDFHFRETSNSHKHPKILTGCRLVVITRQGRERYCEAKLEKPEEVSDWVEQYRKTWTVRSDGQDQYLAELQAKNKRPGRKK
ncbi:MAG: hypothetical protein P4L51_13465 [Puia sp.]|nr:hypothetical protein [Puia sp.]